jgi:hypothetical protein
MAQSETATVSSDLRDGQHDFDFLFGAWKVRNRRLAAPLAGSSQWREFDGTLTARPVWGGAANVDEYTWANRARGVLETPMVGEFHDGRGEFYDQEQFRGRSIYVRYVWSGISKTSCRWEQAFSGDGGKTWETNWVMELTRIE